MAHLTDSPFEAVKICQGCYSCWNTVPLNDSERVERIFVIISPSRYLSINHWIGGPGSTSEGYDI